MATSKRDAPAYQEYAANMLARAEYRMASLAERGLLHTLRHECWVNGRVPADQSKLARYLGLAVEDVATCLPGVMWMFEALPCGQWVICPELEAYRSEQADRRQRMSEGGKAGADKARKVRQSQAATSEAQPETPHKAPHKGGHVAPSRGLRLDESSSVQNSHVLMEGESREWLSEYERASNGH